MFEAAARDINCAISGGANCAHKGKMELQINFVNGCFDELVLASVATPKVVSPSDTFFLMVIGILLIISKRMYLFLICGPNYFDDEQY